MARNRLWVLNFDADDELAKGSSDTPSRAVLSRFAVLEQHVSALLAPGDRVFRGESGERVDPDAFEGRAWSPTPRARRAWSRAGVTVPHVPTVEALRRVTSRRFAAGLGQTLPKAAFVDDLEGLSRVIARVSPTGQWLLKRAFGFAGRGRKRVDSVVLPDSMRGWIEASFTRGGGLQVEPFVRRDGDFALHGFVDYDGSVTLGEVTMQRVDTNGAWIASERAGHDAVSHDERSALITSATDAAAALFSAGYFGPFGVDAFRWIDVDGARRFNARCEINARYSMGWAVGMGDRRPDLVVR
jgi:hypothetical protein